VIARPIASTSSPYVHMVCKSREPLKLESYQPSIWHAEQTFVSSRVLVTPLIYAVYSGFIEVHQRMPCISHARKLAGLLKDQMWQAVAGFRLQSAKAYLHNYNNGQRNVENYSGRRHQSDGTVSILLSPGLHSKVAPGWTTISTNTTTSTRREENVISPLLEASHFPQILCQLLDLKYFCVQTITMKIASEIYHLMK